MLKTGDEATEAERTRKDGGGLGDVERNEVKDQCGGTCQQGHIPPGSLILGREPYRWSVLYIMQVHRNYPNF